MQKIINSVYRSLLIFVVIFFSRAINAKEPFFEPSYFVENSIKLSAHQRAHWKILLHYKGEKSVISDSSFFLAEDGHRNPESELKKTITEFFRKDIPLSNNHAICRFPARLKWIKKELNIPLNALPKVNCSDFDEYIKKTAANKISIVFASENVNNLMSMMGHIFLKINGERDGGEVAHALGYFANYSSINPISFLVGAVSYGAPGVYILEPYQKKIDEYNDRQKRSIWEYKLNLTQDQIDNVVSHIWEMRRIRTKYNFITHNCGSALLYLLYVADSNLQKIYNPLDAPLDIIKKLNQENYIKEINLSPSDSYEFRMIADNFSTSDRVAIEKFLEDGDIKYLKNNSWQKESNIAYGGRVILDYKLVNKDISQVKYNSLVEEIHNFSKSLPRNNLIYNVKDPLKKSKSSRLSLGYKNQGYNKDLVNFGFYPVYNSINGNNSQYFNEIDLQLMNLEGGYYSEKNKVLFDNIDLIKIKNLVAYDSFVNGLSGSFKINFERERFDANSSKIFPNTTFGIGIGEGVLNNKILFYSMANFGYSYFQGNNVSYASPEIGMVLKEGNFGKLYTKYTKYISSNKYKYNEVLSLEQTFFLLDNHDVVMSYKNIDGEIEGRFNSFSLEYQFHF
jgi:hypothetical protein